MTVHPTVMIIGGGRWQVPLIRRAVDLGFRVIATDRSGKAPARALAHTFHCIDMQDLDGLLGLAGRERVDLVISDQTDRAVPVIARLNQALGLPGIRPDTALRFTNKRMMRRALRNAGISLPLHCTAHSSHEACDAASLIGYPVIIKPLASQSSIGVYHIEDEDTLRRRFDACLLHSGDAILVEEYVNGTELTVEGLVLNRRHYVLGVSEKAHYRGLPCVARRLAYPPRLNGVTLRALRAATNAAVRALGLADGLTHAEFRVRDGVPYLIEIAARGCGHGVASTIVPHVSGIDVYGILLRHMLGEDVVVPPLRSRAGLLEFLQFRPGRVLCMHGIEDARRRRVANILSIPYQPGDTIVPPTNDTDRGAYFIALDDTRDRIESRAALLRQLIHVEYA